MRLQGLGFIGAALAVHLAIPGLARIAPRWEPPMLARSSRVLRLETIDVEVAPPTPPEPLSETMPREIEPPRPDLRTPPRETDPRVTPPSPEVNVPPEPSTTTAPSAAPTAPPSDYDKAPDVPGGLPGVPGLDGRPVWGLPGILSGAPVSAAAPTTIPRAPLPARDSANKVLEAVINAKDHAVGLDLPGAGTIAAKIVEAVWASDTPAESRGTFQVRLSPKGQVVSVRSLSSSGGPSEPWRSAASLAASNLASFSLKMPASYATGAVVTVQVVSKVQLPAGASKSTFTFDLSDIGAKKHRVVTSSFSVTPAS